MDKRGQMMKRIGESIGPIETETDQIIAIQSLCFIAATMANAMSGNNVAYSEAHVLEATDDMTKALEDRFDIEIFAR